MDRLETLMRQHGENWRRFHGGWPKGHIYNQNDPRKIAVDRGRCTACALTNSATAVNGAIGDNYPSMIYGAAKARQASENSETADRSGLSITEGAKVAMEIFGGDGPYKLKTLPQIITWLSLAPVVVGFYWDDGMANPSANPGFWNFFFGPRWCRPVPADEQLSEYRHAVTIYGSTPKGGGYVKIENSYGNWGNKGSARLSHADLYLLLQQRQAFAYGIEWPTTVRANVS